MLIRKSRSQNIICQGRCLQAGQSFLSVALCICSSPCEAAHKLADFCTLHPNSTSEAPSQNFPQRGGGGDGERAAKRRRGAFLARRQKRRSLVVRRRPGLRPLFLDPSDLAETRYRLYQNRILLVNSQYMKTEILVSLVNCLTFLHRNDRIALPSKSMIQLRGYRVQNSRAGGGVCTAGALCAADRSGRRPGRLPAVRREPAGIPPVKE